MEFYGRRLSFFKKALMLSFCFTSTLNVSNAIWYFFPFFLEVISFLFIRGVYVEGGHLFCFEKEGGYPYKRNRGSFPYFVSPMLKINGSDEIY
jgi:hypothetical protein